MTDITELVKRLRASDAHPLSIHGQTMIEAADALEAQAKEIADSKEWAAKVEDANDWLIERNRTLDARIAELEAALKPLEKAWLFPDDLGEEASAIIRSEPDWNEEENDMSREDVIVCRGEIRKARTALNGEKDV